MSLFFGFVFFPSFFFEFASFFPLSLSLSLSLRMQAARSRPASAGAAGRCRAAFLRAATMLPFQRRSAPHLDCRIAPRARGGGAAKSLNRFQRRRLLRTSTPTPTPTPTTATAAFAPSLASSGGGLALLALSSAAAQASQSHPWGARLSSPLVAMLLGGFAAAAFPGVLSSSAGLPSAVSGTLVPLAACLALLEIDDDGSGGGGGGGGGGGESPEEEKKSERTESREGGVHAAIPPEGGNGSMDPTLAVSVSFALASLATLVATLVAVFLCVRAPPLLSSSFLLPFEAMLPRPLLVKVAACLCASYIGGSVNFAATAAALGLGSSAQGARAMAAAFAADLVAMALYFGALTALKVSEEEDEWARGGEDSFSSSPSSAASSSSSSRPPTSSTSAVSTLSAALSLAAASCSIALGEAVAVPLGCPPASLAVAALAASAFGLAGRRAAGRAAAPPRSPSASPFAGASAASSSLMLLFFASCGAQAGSPSSLRAAASMGGFVGLLLALQLAATLALGRGMGGGGSFKRRGLCRLPLPALVVGANAAVGGPGTAAAAAAARSWSRLVRPAVLTGSAGYAIGTGIGVGVASVLSRAFL